MKKILVAMALAAVVLTGCKSQVKLEPVAEPSWYLNENYFKAYNDMYAEMSLSSSDIVLVGDEYMERGVWNEFFADTTLTNRGIAGGGIEHVLWRIDRIAAQKPAKIVVSGGFNDINHGTSVEDVVSMTSQVFERCKALSPSSRLAYVNIVPLSTSEKNAQFEEVNARVRKIASASGVEYIDAASVLAEGVGSGEYSFDGGIMLNGAGYAALAGALEGFVGKPHVNAPAPEPKATAGKAQKKDFGTYYNSWLSVFRSLPASEGKIVLLGDSLTERGLWSELFPFTPVLDRGIGGDTIEGIAARLDEVARLNPSRIFLMVGCNNLSGREKVDVSKVWAEYEKLIKEIKKQMPETTLYVQSILPVAKDYQYSDVFVGAAAEINKLLEAGVERYGYFYLDIASKLADEEGFLRGDLSVDGVHLSPDGYFIWATQLLQGNRLMKSTTPEFKVK